jgi:hypothetical protein
MPGGAPGAAPRDAAAVVVEVAVVVVVTGLGNEAAVPARVLPISILLRSPSQA